MLVSIGMMVACYCIARLMLVTLTMPSPTPPSFTARLTVCLIAALGVLGVSYCAWVLLEQGTDHARPRVEVR